MDRTRRWVPFITAPVPLTGSALVRAVAYSAGMVYSAEADPLTITAAGAPLITGATPEPDSRARQAWSFLCVQASSTLPLEYQWRLNGMNVAVKPMPALSFPMSNWSMQAPTRGGGQPSRAGHLRPSLLTVQVPLAPPGDDFADRLSLAGVSGAVSGWNLGPPGRRANPTMRPSREAPRFVYLAGARFPALPPSAPPAAAC